MSQNIISQRLVNATNILFHLMDLQPYALVLPMGCKTAERNKRKIMQKIMVNNRAPVTSYGTKNLSEVKEDDEEGKAAEGCPSDGSQKAATGAGSNTDMEDNDDRQSNNKDPSSSTLSYDNHNDLLSSHAKKAASADATCPLSPTRDDSMDSASSYVITEEEYKLPLDDVNSPFYTVNNVIDRLDSDDMKGCMIMLAARCDSYFAVVPLAGGIIEIYDEHERSIQAMWVNRSLEQRADIHTLLKTLVLRIFAHAYQIQLPDRRSTKSNKLVSIYQSMLITFPHECFSFIEKDMLLSKHYESPGFNEAHNDNPKVPCRCHKVAHEASEMFYGISESRFNNLYTNLYEKMLFSSIGKMTPIVKMFPSGAFSHSEKMDQIAKAVREIERSLKDQGTNKRFRKG